MVIASAYYVPLYTRQCHRAKLSGQSKTCFSSFQESESAPVSPFVSLSLSASLFLPGFFP